MDSKTLNVLEYPKILDRLAGFCDFSASMDLARALEPTSSHELAVARLAETTEARKLFSLTWPRAAAYWIRMHYSISNPH
jgi:DNA mismatch repair protein MutS2